MQYVVIGFAILAVAMIVVGAVGVWLYDTFDPLKDWGPADPSINAEALDRIHGGRH